MAVQNKSYLEQKSVRTKVASNKSCFEQKLLQTKVVKNKGRLEQKLFRTKAVQNKSDCSEQIIFSFFYFVSFSLTLDFLNQKASLKASEVMITQPPPPIIFFFLFLNENSLIIFGSHLYKTFFVVKYAYLRVNLHSFYMELRIFTQN